MRQGPVAVGGIGGSGTRIVAGILRDLGVFIGTDLPGSLDTVWYAVLFGRRDVLLEPLPSLRRLTDLFARQMRDPRPLRPDERALIEGFTDPDRCQHDPALVAAWAESFVAHCAGGRPQPVWGWKVPYTHVLIDRLLGWYPDLAYVHLSRNPLDMAYSRNQNQLQHWGPIFLNRAVEIGPRDSLAYWCAVHRRMQRVRAAFPGRFLALDYDALVAAPRRGLEELFAFLGQEAPADLAGRFAERIRAPEHGYRPAEVDLSAFRREDLHYLQEIGVLEDAPGEAAPPPATLEEEIRRSRATAAGTANRRAFVGPPAQYDFMGATQFRLLTALGLREEHRVVDIGCGSLRGGRFLIPYLLPGHYTGIEPNSWLWQEALDRELGRDLARLRTPRFVRDASFRMAQVETGSADFIVAQSIYSHTGADLFERSVAAAARVLAPGGQFLFTVVDAAAPNAAGMADGTGAQGWFYPECVFYHEEAVRRIAAAADLFAEPLDWFHPRQRWYRVTRDPDLRLDAGARAALGSGRPLFDPRFG